MNFPGCPVCGSAALQFDWDTSNSKWLWWWCTSCWFSWWGAFRAFHDGRPTRWLIRVPVEKVPYERY